MKRVIRWFLRWLYEGTLRWEAGLQLIEAKKRERELLKAIEEIMELFNQSLPVNEHFYDHTCYEKAENIVKSLTSSSEAPPASKQS
jgi:hypothetical protein